MESSKILAELLKNNNGTSGECCFMSGEIHIHTYLYTSDILQSAVFLEVGFDTLARHMLELAAISILHKTHSGDK